jgi:hypothetical protein
MYDHSWHDSLEIHHRLIPDLTTARFKGYSPKSHLEGSMALLRLINQMKKLSSLSLGNQVIFKSTFVHYIRDDILRGQIQLPALQVLDLNGMEMSLGKLQRFLIEHKHTLKQVHLQNLLINIPAPGDMWLSRIMGWVRDNTALHRVTLGDIRVVLDNDWQDSITKQPGVPWHRGVANFEGSAAVRAGLDELCDQHKRLRKLFTHVHMTWELRKKIPLFARTAGMCEEEFRQMWASCSRHR